MTDHADGLKVATRIFRASLGVSVAANAVGGYFGPSELDPWVTAVIHSLAPLFLAGAEMLLVKVASTGHSSADRFRVWTASGVGVGAFAASAKNLAHLAEMAGFGEVMAWTFPAIVDLTMITAMVTVVWSAKAQTDSTTEPVVDGPVRAAPLPEIGQTVKQRKPAASRTSKPKTSSKTNSKARLDVAALADALAVDPSVTAQVLADRFGVSKRTIQRTDVWKNRKNNETNETIKSEVAV